MEQCIEQKTMMIIVKGNNGSGGSGGNISDINITTF